jgi:hypothetical protein
MADDRNPLGESLSDALYALECIGEKEEMFETDPAYEKAPYVERREDCWEGLCGEMVCEESGCLASRILRIRKVLDEAGIHRREEMPKPDEDESDEDA